MAKEEAMTRLVNRCAFRAGWQVYHAAKHEDYASLVPAARAGYDAAARGATDFEAAFEAWRLPTFPQTAMREA
jgi:hypothetical protein